MLAIAGWRSAARPLFIDAEERSPSTQMALASSFLLTVAAAASSRSLPALRERLT
jgi:hypothetical protein